MACAPLPITRRRFLHTAATAGAGIVLPSALRGAPAIARKARPNVLFIITDQQHIDTIQALGCSHIRTPGMDRLARRGTCFTQSHSTNPLCSPARSSMFTGRPTSETGVYANNLAIRRGMPNVGQWLRQESDYETVYAGKWHVPRGFTHDVPGFQVISTGIGGQGNLGDATTSTACEGYLRTRNDSKPFFLVASFLQPHDICEWLRLHQSPEAPELPYPELAEKLPPLPRNFGFDEREPDAMKSRRAGNEGARGKWNEQKWRYYIWSYYRHVEMVDAEIARILDALDDTGLADNTVVIFTSDHGEGTAHHQMTRKNSLYEEAVKVPLIVSMPGHIPENHVDRHTLAAGYDITPTICDVAGVTPPPDCRGRSLRDALEGKPDQRECCVAEVLNNTGRMVRTPKYKYIAYKDDPVEQLFDMDVDPGELNNLADEARYGDELRQHRRLLAHWEAHLDVAPNVPR